MKEDKKDLMANHRLPQDPNLIRQQVMVERIKTEIQNQINANEIINKLKEQVKKLENGSAVDKTARTDIQSLSDRIEALRTTPIMDPYARSEVDRLSSEVDRLSNEKADQTSVTHLSDRINVLESASTSQDINKLSLRVEELETKPDKDINARQGVEQLSLAVQGKADKNNVTILETRVKELEKSTKSSIDRDAWNGMKEKVDDLSSRMNSPGNRNSRKLGVCLFLCAVLLFNILVIWFITCMPTGGSIEWLFLLPLLAITVIDAVCVALLSYRIIADACENAWVGVSAAIALLVLNIVAIWLFAFYPSELRAAVYALLVFLMVANIAEGVATVFYSYGNKNGYIPSIFTFIALLPVLIIFIGWIRV